MTRWVLSVDLWGTLIDYGDRDAEARWRIREFGNALAAFGYHPPPDELERVIRSSRTNLLAQQRADGVQVPVRDQVRQLIASFGADRDETLIDVLTVAHTHAVLRACPEVLPGAHLALREARARGAHVVLTSNTLATPAEITQQILDGHHLSDLLDDAVYSSQIGFAKPRAEVFAAVAARAGVPLTAVVHVGNDWQTDVLGALHAGCAAVYFNPYDKPLRAPVPQITALTELSDAAVDALATRPDILRAGPS
uniref:HAD family hydrolase n=1 Tax=Nonomuraea sp. CA-252377 TaxID=3240003 RepID=UPI003F492CEE